LPNLARGGWWSETVLKKTTTMETVTPSQAQICPVSSVYLRLLLVCCSLLCCSLLSAVVRQHLSHYARRVMTWESSNWATLTLSWIKANHFPLRQKMQSLRTFLLSLEDFAHWNRETLRNSTAILSWKQQLLWEKKSAAKDWKQIPFIHSFIHYCKNPRFVVAICHLTRFSLMSVGKNNNFAFICDDCGEEKNMESS
jgi:hypothetical protein